jgi:hypothetical protein
MVAWRTRCGSAKSLHGAFGLFGKAGAKQVHLFVYKRFHCPLIFGWRMYDCNILLELINKSFLIPTPGGDFICLK